MYIFHNKKKLVKEGGEGGENKGPALMTPPHDLESRWDENLGL